MSLMPLGVLFSSGKEMEPQLAVSELFLLQYGISMKPGDQGQPGPSTKAAYGEIAAAVHVADKAIIPNVITAVIHRFGEIFRTIKPPDGSPSHGPSPRQRLGEVSPVFRSNASVSAGDSKSIMDNIFVRSHPAKAIDFPPLLDEFSRTLAAPYGEDLHHGSSSGRIASHLSPLSGILVWSHEGKCLKWRQRKIPKKDGKGQQPEYAPMDILEREFEHSQILPGSSLEVELKEAGVSRCVVLAKRPEELSSLQEALNDAEAAMAQLEATCRRAAPRPSVPCVAAVLLLAPTAPSTALKASPGPPGTCLLASEHSASGHYSINSLVPIELQEWMGHTIPGRVPSSCVVRIIHGDKDEAIPIEASECLESSLLAQKVKASLRRVEGGDHRLSSESELLILEETLSCLGWMELCCWPTLLGWQCVRTRWPLRIAARAAHDASIPVRGRESCAKVRAARRKVYFGVGTYGIAGDRQRGQGACYRLKVEGVDKDIIAQSINTGWDVDGNQFDLQIAAGGAGAFNVCAGSAGSMFSGGKSAWGCTYGGVDSDEACAALPAEPRNGHAMRAAGDSLVKMCQYSWQKKVRLSGAGLPAGKCKYNPTILDVSRVRCPEQLVQLTQLQRQDDPHSFTASSSQRPKGFPNRDQKCRSEDPSAGLGYCLTRMMD
eukprot:g15888.t1